MAWHLIAGVGDARIPDGIAEIDVSQHFRDAFVGDVHRLGAIFGRERERSPSTLREAIRNIECACEPVVRSYLFSFVSHAAIRKFTGSASAQRETH